MEMNLQAKKEIRIANVNLPVKKAIFVALSYICGIGQKSALNMCKKLSIGHDKKMMYITDGELEILRNYIRENYKVEGELTSEIRLNIQKKKDIGSYQGFMHRRKLPVRGQRTRSNAKTRRRFKY